MRISIAVGCLMVGAWVHARELRTPLSLQREYFHVPVSLNNNSLFDKWAVGLWSGAYHRSAFDAFTNCHGTHTTSLAHVFFCSSSFTVQEAFADATVTVPGNPSVNFALITPQLTYTEDGVVIGAHLQRRFDNELWRVGIRGALPVKRIETRVDNLGSSSFAEAIDNVGARRNEILNSKTYNDVYAYRLDFLSSLVMTTGDNLINYANPLTSDHITIADQDLTDANNNPVHVIKRTDGTLPVMLQWTALDTDAVTFLGNDGSGLAADQRGRFNQATDYTDLGNDNAVQRQLYVVPTVDDPQVSDVLSQPSGDAIRTGIGNALRNITSSSAIDYLAANNVSFDTQHTVGIGDLDTEVYVGYDAHEQVYVEGSFGVRWPTGKKNNDPGKLFLIQRGSNGHCELRGGLTGIWRPCTWFSSKLYASYTRALEREEQIAATFSGATIKGIGPRVPAAISWGYFWGTFDCTFVHPRNENIGFDIGYEAYVKQRDNVKFCVDNAIDFVDAEHSLSTTRAECATRVVSHKIRTEIFHNWDVGGLFAGFSHVVAGQNAMRESEWHLGMELRY